MTGQVKPTKTEKILLSVTAAFLCLLLALMLYGKATGAEGHYTVAAEQSAGVSSGSAASAAASSATREAVGPVNINTASAEELSALPGIGETLAGRIVAYRTKHGAFSSTEEVQKVSGIGEKIFAEIADRITVGG